MHYSGMFLDIAKQLPRVQGQDRQSSPDFIAFESFIIGLAQSHHALAFTDLRFLLPWRSQAPEFLKN
jgi:hypothetical protein